MTKSAAVRISDAARAMDVTELLRNTLCCDGNPQQDALVLVGTLYDTTLVEFEHEKTTSEPFHVVKTLQAEENPLQVRDALLQHLLQGQQSHPPSNEKGMSPKLQWFFVPSCSKMPNCIELDGYCTGDDETQECESDESDIEDETVDSHEIDSEYWWRNERTDSDITAITQQSKQLHKEQRRLYQLQNCQSALDARHVVSGYLLKRSSNDKHVWKRVHVVLTDDTLWIVSRLKGGIKIARHVRISLNRALLMEANTDRLPHAFEVVSKSGISHVFRACSHSLQQKWIHCVKSRIAQCQDNDLMQHAELIVEDEALARSKRMMGVAVEPLMRDTMNECKKELRMTVLKWGMDVTAYKETCRHVQSRMPAKRPVVVVSSTEDLAAPSPRRLFASPNGQQYAGENGGDEVDSDTRDMIRSAWESAAVLLARATRIRDKPSNSLETLCRHVDYVITGRFRDSVGMDHSCDPPPADLFDPLLAELQSGCSSSSEKMNGHAIETPLGK